MAISNKDRISRTLDLLRDGLVPFVERELKAKLTRNVTKLEQIQKLRDGVVHANE